MIAVLFVALIILTSANLARAAISGFWADCGQAIVTECHAAGQKYPAKQLVKSFLTQGLDRYIYDPQKRGRDILLCTTIMAIPCIVGLVLLGRRVLCG